MGARKTRCRNTNGLDNVKKRETDDENEGLGATKVRERCLCEERTRVAEKQCDEWDWSKKETDERVGSSTVGTVEGDWDLERGTLKGRIPVR